ncbi:hypothetical protein HKB02_02350 [Vibrio parahaemolyticus]|nr:hypothetical protein [Vibrio parahaemolyticus]
MKHEAIADIQQMNMDAIHARDERIVKNIKDEQEQLVKVTCHKEKASKA